MQALVDWARVAYADEMNQHKDEYPDRVPIEEPDLREKQFLTWFVMEWVNPRTRTTLLAEFIEKFVKNPEMASKIGNFKRVFYSTFLATQRISDNVLTAVDQYSKKSYRIKFNNKLPDSCEDLTFSGYISPWEKDGTHVTMGIITFSYLNPYGFITPDMQNILYRLLQKDKQNSAEDVPMPRKLSTYLKNQPVELVDIIAEFLDVSGERKRDRIKAIAAAISANGARLLESLSKDEQSCLLFVYGSKGMATKHGALERRFGDDDYEAFASQRARSTIGQLREKGMLMVGKKAIESKRYKVAAVPAELIPALDGLDPPSEPQSGSEPAKGRPRLLKWFKKT